MPETKADDILRRAAQHMEDRAKTYDAAGGERSMGKVADIIRTLYAEQLERGEFTEEMAWGLQVVLKLVRSSQGGHRADNYEDGAAYFALMGECAAKSRGETGQQLAPIEMGRMVAEPARPRDDLGGSRRWTGAAWAPARPRDDLGVSRPAVPGCSRCGMAFNGAMGYVCPSEKCPFGTQTT